MTSWQSELHSFSPADIFLLDEWPPCLNMEFTDHKMGFIQTQSMNKWTHGKWPLKSTPPSRLERTFCLINFRWAIVIKHRMSHKDLKMTRNMLHGSSQALFSYPNSFLGFIASPVGLSLEVTILLLSCRLHLSLWNTLTYLFVALFLILDGPFP